MKYLTIILITTTLFCSACDPFSGCCPPHGISHLSYINSKIMYVECNEGIAYLKICPEDCYWNQTADSCHYSNETICIADNSRTTTEAPMSISCADKLDGTFLANPDDCAKYYRCDHAIAYPKSCSNDTLWNQSILSCDHPENVDCITNISSPKVGKKISSH